MKRKGNLFVKALRNVIIPFLTVFCIITISTIVYVLTVRSVGFNNLVIWLVMIATAIMLSIVFVLCDAFRRKIMIEKPVNMLLEATEKIASGDFSVKLKLDRPYEDYNDFDLIMENVNKMAKALKQSEMLNADFISNVSHEIKTPLSVIKNYVELISREKNEEKRAEYLDIVLKATIRLNGLVENVLKLNKLENQKHTVKFEEIDLHENLAESVLSFEELIEKKGIDLQCDFDEVKIYSEKYFLQIIWNNLLSNAVKFTEKGGKIFVSLKKKKDKAVITVQDSGCGISTETGAHIFDKFYQGDTSHSGEGNGLGLALVKKVIDILGGEISVKSEIDKGSEFTIILKGVINEN